MSTLTEAFTATYAASPAGQWSAPGRVNLIGEHTDYNGGLALPIALPHRTFVAAAARDDDLIRMASVQASGSADPAGALPFVSVDLASVGPGSPADWTAYVAGVVWALREAGHPVRGLDLIVDGRVPLGAGLSSSAALECAVGAACSDLFNLSLLGSDASRAHLAAACMRAENDVAGAPTGGMDQSASLLCREGHALLLDCRSGATRHVPVDFAGSDLALLVVDTKAHHALNDGQYAARRTSCEEVAQRLGVPSLREVVAVGWQGRLDSLDDDELRRRATHVVTEIGRVSHCVEALQDNDFERVGRLFVESHASLRDDYEVSAPELDTVVEVAVDAGALGARMTGGGFGGSAIALVPQDRADAVASAVAQSFADRGWRAPEHFTCLPSAAAGRDA